MVWNSSPQNMPLMHIWSWHPGCLLYTIWSLICTPSCYSYSCIVVKSDQKVKSIWCSWWKIFKVFSRLQMLTSTSEGISLCLNYDFLTFAMRTNFILNLDCLLRPHFYKWQWEGGTNCCVKGVSYYDQQIPVEEHQAGKLMSLMSVKRGILLGQS